MEEQSAKKRKSSTTNKKPTRRKSGTTNELPGKRKRNSATTNEQQLDELEKGKKTSSLLVLDRDPFINQVVGFLCTSDVGRMLIESFNTKWREDAICKILDKTNGHIVGVVMRKTGKGKLSSSKGTPAYDIAWEHTSLGETSVSGAYLLNGCLVGSRIVKL